MTEAEWLAGGAPRPSIEWLFFDAPVSDRKLRLFAVSCCRPIVSRLQEAAQPAARLLDSVEALVDGLIQPEALTRDLRELDDWAYERLGEEHRAFAEGRAGSKGPFGSIALGFIAVLNSARQVEDRDAPGAGHRRREFFRNQNTEVFGPIFVYQAALFSRIVPSKAFVVAKAEEARFQWHLLRDIFGNPFRPVTFSPEWRTGTVLSLARQMYESRDFGAMPILADALQDAGCDNEDILNHCRGDGPHVRGCWVVDRVLGKE